MNPFESGRIYRRIEDIHNCFGGQRQGGISIPALTRGGFGNGDL